MLEGISPLLTGELLWRLDAMGHSDSIVVADAHFPAARLGARLIDLPGTLATDVVATIRTVLPLDDVAPLVLMATANGAVPPVHGELTAAAGLGDAEPVLVDREEFYELAGSAFVIVRTGEQRTYANALLHKGLVTPAPNAARTS